MIRSRSGKSAPLSVWSGSASAAASETAPRIPAQPPTNRCCQVARRARWASRRSIARIT